MAKKKDEAESDGAQKGKPTQREAVQQALAAGKDSPSEGVAFVKEQFGITLNNGAFSTIKSQLKKAAGESKPRGKPGRKPASAVTATAPVRNGVPNMALQIEAIKTLVDSLGVDQVVSIARLFAK